MLICRWVDVHLGMIAIASCFDSIVINNVDVVWGRISLVEADLVSIRVINLYS